LVNLVTVHEGLTDLDAGDTANSGLTMRSDNAVPEVDLGGPALRRS
jgi:hypothetical protein